MHADFQSIRGDAAGGAGIIERNLFAANAPGSFTLQAQVGAAMAEHMKDTPMYTSYAAIAPHPEEFPKLLDRMGEC